MTQRCSWLSIPVGWLYFFAMIITLSVVLLPAEVNAAETADQLVRKAYIRQRGQVVIEETITFSTPLPVDRFIWHVPDSTTNIPRVMLDNTTTATVYWDKSSEEQKGIRIRGAQSARVFHLSYIASAYMNTSEGTYRAQVLFTPQLYAIQYIHARIVLPAPAVNGTLTHRTFGSRSTPPLQTTVINDRETGLEGKLIPPDAAFASEVTWVGIPTFWQRLVAYSQWELLGVTASMFVLPALTFITVIGMMITVWIKERLQTSVQKTVVLHDLPPAVVGVLVHKRVTHDVLLSAVLDLARRGYISILRQESGKYVFILGKTVDISLPLWERNLLDHVFSSQIATGNRQLIMFTQSRFYSPRLATLYETLYQEVADRGLTDHNPHRIQIYYKLLGLFLYLGALMSISYFVFTGKPWEWIAPIVGAYVASLIVIRFSHLMTKRTALGHAYYLEAQRARKLFQDRTALPYSAHAFEEFFTNLPYSVAVGAEKRWIQRFRNHEMMLPSWFFSDKPLSTGSFVESFIHVADDISHHFANAHGPVVE